MNPYLRITWNPLKYLKCPTNPDSVFKLMKILNDKIKFACAVEAMEMILPIWETDEIVVSKFSIARQEFPRKLLQISKKYINNQPLDNVDTLYLDIPQDGNYVNSTSPPGWMSICVFNVVSLFLSLTLKRQTAAQNTATATAAIIHAAHGSIPSNEWPYKNIYAREIYLQEFYKEWWGRCEELITIYYNSYVN